VTVDRYTFIADERFQVIAAPPGDSWILQIKYVQPRDGGIYECQISTEPKLAYPVYLTVLVPTIRYDLMVLQRVHRALRSNVIEPILSSIKYNHNPKFYALYNPFYTYYTNYNRTLKTDSLQTEQQNFIKVSECGSNIYVYGFIEWT